jgi:AraC family carnitine catabolism transcriptional activator
MHAEGPILPRHVGIMLMPGFSMLALFGIVEPIRLANQLLGRCHYQWTIFSGDGLPARASCGLTVAAAPRPDPQSAPQCILIVAGFDPWPQNDRR